MVYRAINMAQSIPTYSVRYSSQMAYVICNMLCRMVVINVEFDVRIGCMKHA